MSFAGVTSPVPLIHTHTHSRASARKEIVESEEALGIFTERLEQLGLWITHLIAEQNFVKLYARFSILFFWKIVSHEICTKSFSKAFMLIFYCRANNYCYADFTFVLDRCLCHGAISGWFTRSPLKNIRIHKWDTEFCGFFCFAIEDRNVFAALAVIIFIFEQTTDPSLEIFTVEFLHLTCYLAFWCKPNCTRWL